MKDYTKELGFWKRLNLFISKVDVNDPISEEEKQMIINNCNLKILNFISKEVDKKEWGKRIKR